MPRAENSSRRSAASWPIMSPFPHDHCPLLFPLFVLEGFRSLPFPEVHSCQPGPVLLRLSTLLMCRLVTKPDERDDHRLQAHQVVIIQLWVGALGHIRCHVASSLSLHADFLKVHVHPVMQCAQPAAWHERHHSLVVCHLTICALLVPAVPEEERAMPKESVFVAQEQQHRPAAPSQHHDAAALHRVSTLPFDAPGILLSH
mmetsp:Transcript_23172/g.54233  ORF Transcript_23172/g.54233 Transcript_23172/m.54233 type:complete len:201 (+) Transcript_23172:63-665(+)